MYSCRGRIQIMRTTRASPVKKKKIVPIANVEARGPWRRYLFTTNPILRMELLQLTVAYTDSRCTDRRTVLALGCTLHRVYFRWKELKQHRASSWTPYDDEGTRWLLETSNSHFPREIHDVQIIVKKWNNEHRCRMVWSEFSAVVTNKI